MDWIKSLQLRANAPEVFRGLTPNPKGRKSALKNGPPDRRYIMFFTPRSGSSRITAMVRKTGTLSNLGEFFNPNFVPKIAQGLGAQDLEDYVHVLTQRHNTNGTFGSQITYMQLVRLFGTRARFHRTVAPDTAFWLIRHDIVAQAVSLVRMIQTKVAHTANSTATDLDEADSRFTYRADLILKHIEQIAWAERQTDAYFRRFGPDPMRLSYESLSRMDPLSILDMMARHVGTSLDAERDYETEHKKLPGTKGSDFAARFREENADVVARIEEKRADLIARHP